MRKDTDFYKLIKRICDEKGISMRNTSFDYVTTLEKDGKIRHIIGINNASLELNSASSYKIASDKFACFSVLAQNEIPTMKYDIVFNPKTRSDYMSEDINKAMILFDLYGGKVVLKANVSSEGKDVFLISSKEELKNTIIEEFANNKDSVSICPFYDIKYEYRAIFLDGEIVFCYKKEKPYIIENGKKIETSWKHNLSLGGVPSLEIEDEIRKKVYDLAKRAGKAIGIRFASVDIAETKDGELLVVEINSNVCMEKFAQNISDGLQIEYEIFSNAINRMFEG